MAKRKTAVATDPNAENVATGSKILERFIADYKIEPEDAVEHCCVTDAVIYLLHHAAAHGFDCDQILLSAKGHFDAERIESCPKCGTWVTRERAFLDEGEGDEEGRTFYYCSEHCRETH